MSQVRPKHHAVHRRRYRGTKNKDRYFCRQR